MQSTPSTLVALCGVVLALMLGANGVVAAPYNIHKISPESASQKLYLVNVSLYGAIPGNKVFFMKAHVEGEELYNCSHPPTIGSTRTTTVTIKPPRNAEIYVRDMEAGEYTICYFNHSVAEPILYWNTSYINATGWRNFTVRNQTELWGNHSNIYNNGSSFQYNFSYWNTHRRRDWFYQQVSHDTAARHPPAPILPFVALLPKFYIAGPIDSAKSRLCCDGPFEVGNRTYCTISAVDSNGIPTGSAEDACHFHVCPLQDGSGHTIHEEAKPYYVSPGKFQFYFTAFRSGCKGRAGAVYDGHPLGNMNTFFTVYPGHVDHALSTSECEATYDGAGQQHPICTITQRDKWSNPIKRCSFDTKGNIKCKYIVNVEA